MELVFMRNNQMIGLMGCEDTTQAVQMLSFLEQQKIMKTRAITADIETFTPQVTPVTYSRR